MNIGLELNYGFVDELLIEIPWKDLKIKSIKIKIKGLKLNIENQINNYSTNYSKNVVDLKKEAL